MDSRGGSPPRRIAPHHQGIRRSRHTTGAEWRKRLSFVILHRLWGRRTRPSPLRPAMDAAGAGALPRGFRLLAWREGVVGAQTRCRTAGKALPRGFAPRFGALGSPSPSRPAMDSGGAGFPPVWHRRTRGFDNARVGSVQNDGGHSPPSFGTVRLVLAPVRRCFPPRWTRRERFPFPRNWTPGARREEPVGTGPQRTRSLIVGAGRSFPNLSICLSVCCGCRYSGKYCDAAAVQEHGERRDRGVAATPEGRRGSR